MKKLLSILILLLVSDVTAEAQSMLKISLADRSPITVSVDGRYFNKRGQSVTVGDLPAGRHRVQIYVTSESRSGRDQENIAYTGYVKTYNGQLTIFTYDENTEATETQDQDMNAMGNAPTPPPPAAPTPTDQYNNNNAPQQDNNYQQDNSNNNEQYAPSQGASPVNDAITTEGKNKLAKLKKKTDAKKTDTEKFTVLKDALKQEMITSDQVAIIMDWFSFESSKVEFAEWAYDHTTDKDNYTNVVEKLAYNNYRIELDNFIKSKK